MNALEVNEIEIRMWAIQQVIPFAGHDAAFTIKEARVLLDWVMEGGKDGTPE